MKRLATIGIAGLATGLLSLVSLAAHAAAPSGAPAALQMQDAAAALVRGNAAQAVQGYSDALADQSLPNDRRATILNDRGVAYTRLGQTKLALEDFNKAVQLFPEYAAVYNNRGNLLMTLGLLKEAVKDFDRAIVLAPGYAAAYNNRAGAQQKLGQYPEALRDYTKAVQLMPANAAPFSGRGRAYLALGRPYAAMRDFTRAVTADGRFASGYRNRAEAALEIGRHEEAVEDLSRAIAFDVNNAEIYVLRGYAYLSARNIESAIKDFSRSVELDPKLAAGYQARGFAHALAEALDDAFADLNKAIDLDPRSAVAFAYRAYVYKLQGQVDVGIKDLQTAVKLDPDCPEALWAKAVIEEEQGRPDQAIADLRRALTLKPGYKDASEALQRLGGTMEGQGEGDKDAPGLGLDPWRVVIRSGRYYAVSKQYPRISVPLETLGEGQPRILEWEIKKPPLKGIGALRYASGTVAAKAGPEETEQIAIVDVDESKVIAVEPHKQGAKLSTWTWEEGRVVVASVDGATDEFSLRTAKVASTQPSRRYSEYDGFEGPGWAPWSQPWAGGPSQQRPPQRRRKQKTLFDLLFAN